MPGTIRIIPAVAAALLATSCSGESVIFGSCDKSIMEEIDVARDVSVDVMKVACGATSRDVYWVNVGTKGGSTRERAAVLEDKPAISVRGNSIVIQVERGSRVYKRQPRWRGWNIIVEEQ